MCLFTVHDSEQSTESVTVTVLSLSCCLMSVEQVCGTVQFVTLHRFCCKGTVYPDYLKLCLLHEIWNFKLGAYCCVFIDL
jgi:hypothetical protein